MNNKSKICKKCSVPITSENYVHYLLNGVYRVRSVCRKCYNRQKNDWYHDNNSPARRQQHRIYERERYWRDQPAIRLQIKKRRMEKAMRNEHNPGK